jgi:uncharacterized protein with FMN-binding domain
VARRLDARVVALSSAAVLAIYGAGYALTQSTIDARAQIAAAARYAPRVLRDGTFIATGASQFGDVTVSLRVVGGRLAAVEIIGVTTFFSADWISGLPASVVRHQGPTVDVVSGATGSTAAFDSAVAAALDKAAAPARAAS